MRHSQICGVTCSTRTDGFICPGPVYVDSNLVGSGKVTKAAIIGQQGGVWATSPGFAVGGSFSASRSVFETFSRSHHRNRRKSSTHSKTYPGRNPRGSVLRETSTSSCNPPIGAFMGRRRSVLSLNAPISPFADFFVSDPLNPSLIRSDVLHVPCTLRNCRYILCRPTALLL